MTSTKKIVYSLLVLLILFFPTILFPETTRVAVLESTLTLKKTPNPIFFAWEMGGVSRTLASLGIPYKTIHEKEMNLPSLRKFKLLILPNSKNMTREEVQAVRSFAESGGKILATGFSSYRDENDQPAGSQNNFRLCALFGADYLRYNPYPPHCGFLKTNRDLGLEGVEMGRNNAIQIHPYPASIVLATWLDDDGKTPSFPENLDAAIIENREKTAIYMGENLFAPENSNSLSVQKLIGRLIDLLLPGTTSMSPQFQGNYPLLPSISHLPQIDASGREIKVGLPYSIGDGYVTCDARFSVYDGNMEIIPAARKKSNIAFTAKGSGFSVAGRLDHRFFFVPENPAFPLKVVLWHGGRQPDSPFKLLVLRGKAILEDISGERSLVNELPVEAYLAGVVSHEVPFYFHKEALKTMAVVARTFALKEMAEKKFKDFDICATVACQAYDGVSYESYGSRKAVLETKQKVVVYKENLADLPYHATCGGITEDIQNIWSLPPAPYLRSVVDGPSPIPENLNTDKGVLHFLLDSRRSFCRASSRFRWRETYSREELEGLFKESLPVILKRQVSFRKINDLEVDGRTPHGRVTSLKITTDAETFEIPKDQIRWLFSSGKIGLGGLQSTLFVIQKEKDLNGNLISVTFFGGGWGHGVGLCQFGAEGMAEAGYSYRQILNHYFPGTLVTSFQLASGKDRILR